jgi:hypothetical protein
MKSSRSQLPTRDRSGNRRERPFESMRQRRTKKSNQARTQDLESSPTRMSGFLPYVSKSDQTYPLLRDILLRYHRSKSLVAYVA